MGGMGYTPAVMVVETMWFQEFVRHFLGQGTRSVEFHSVEGNMFSAFAYTERDRNQIRHSYIYGTLKRLNICINAFLSLSYYGIRPMMPFSLFTK